MRHCFIYLLYDLLACFSAAPVSTNSIQTTNFQARDSRHSLGVSLHCVLVTRSLRTTDMSTSPPTDGENFEDRVFDVANLHTCN
ncbi:secreted RxLR effector peptide protein, putative [Phytophthora infestans T30-4]|uniref:Secreted RxLR effector peptide protein, putative n=1 Tax=Phytophthora infestans (strain T30-4) TaxID=403677 RepID=D0NCB0_PHYIT|nr:secreted RxLR effector peptide protein, putative [Phytophthora infestans T30-4]EEY55624.1 secreted RxLR effector peptide protein, putative [Phytophthora infestans T30-4]|eukprot:XP_002903200.1 secreted RxLR effector peptide protein, putative [Phytophthora infestans T30-4]